jgi:hypothetical protein
MIDGTSFAAKADKAQSDVGKSVVQLARPKEGDVVRGKLRVVGACEGNRAVQVRRVELSVDGRVVSAKKKAPYTFGGTADTLDTTDWPAGIHFLEVRAQLIRKPAVTTSVAVIVANGLSSSQLTVLKETAKRVEQDLAYRQRLVAATRELSVLREEVDYLVSLRSAYLAAMKKPCEAVNAPAVELGKDYEAYLESLRAAGQKHRQELAAANEGLAAQYRRVAPDAGKPASIWPAGSYNGRYVRSPLTIPQGAPSLGNFMWGGGYGKGLNRKTAEAVFSLAQEAGLPLGLCGSHGSGLEFPPADPQRPGLDWRMSYQPRDVMLMKLLHPQTYWSAWQAEIGGCGGSALAAYPKPANRLQAMENFIRNFAAINKPFRDAGVPVVIYDDFGFSPAYQLAAGCDVFVPELYRGQNMEWYLSQARGCSRSLGKDWGGSLADSWWYTTYIYGELGSRPQNPARQNTIDSLSLEERRKLCPNHAPEDIRQAYYYMFYNGCKAMLSEDARYFDRQGQLTSLGKIVQEFIGFLQKHPPIDAPLADIAVVRGLGEGWQGCYACDVRSAGLKSRQDAFSSKSPRDWGQRACYRDWELMNVFFPGFGHWAQSTRYYTGTPLGQIDIISAITPPEGLARYRMLVFLGVNVMTPELRAKLADYVRQGGILVMNAEQLRDQDGRFDAQAAKELFGVTLAAVAPATSETATQDALYPLVLAGATATVKTDSGQPLMVQHSVGKGRAWLTASQWHWALPHGRFESLVTEAVEGIGVPLTLSPASPGVETFVCPFTGIPGAYSLCFFNHQEVQRKRPYYRQLYPTREHAITEAAGLQIVVRPGQNRQATAIDFAPTDFTAMDEIKVAFHSEGARPGGVGLLAFVDRDGHRAVRRGEFFRPFLCQRLDGREGMIEGVFEKYISTRDFNEWIGGDKIDWKTVRRMEIELAAEDENDRLDFTFTIDDLRLVDTLVGEQPRSVDRPIKPFAGKAKVNLAKLGIAGRSDMKVYRIGPQFALEELPVETSKGQLSFGLNLTAEWQEYVLASPDTAVRLFSEAQHR